MWIRHWGLADDPFAGADPPYLPLPSHDMAIARLAMAVERRQRMCAIVAGTGMGKSVVLRRAAEIFRNPRRRTVLVPSAAGGSLLLAQIADGLGLPMGSGSDRDPVWRLLARTLRARAIEGIHVVLLLDGCEGRTDPDLLALLDAAGSRSAPHSLIAAGDDDLDGFDDVIRLGRLSRSEAETYLAGRLAAVGCRDRLFTPRAIGRLHAWSEGVPRALNRLAARAMAEGAAWAWRWSRPRLSMTWESGNCRRGREPRSPVDRRGRSARRLLLASNLGGCDPRRCVRSSPDPGGESDAMTEPSVSLRNPGRAALLAWLVPGLGHFYQGARARRSSTRPASSASTSWG